MQELAKNKIHFDKEPLFFNPGAPHAPRSYVQEFSAKKPSALRIRGTHQSCRLRFAVKRDT